jgi:hypothetical protein
MAFDLDYLRRFVNRLFYSGVSISQSGDQLAKQNPSEMAITI